MDKRFPWSQYTFGGLSACTSVSTLVACSFADGAPVSESQLRSMTEAACKMWRDNHRRSQSVHEVMQAEPFFESTYSTTSWQCSDAPGWLPLRKLFDEPEFAVEQWGAVVTDGVMSCAVGRFRGAWWLFDPHVARLQRAESKAGIHLHSAVNTKRTVDVTCFVHQHGSESTTT